MSKHTELQQGIKEGKLSFKYSPGEEYLTLPGGQKKRGRGRPQTSTKKITQGNTPEDGTREGERRITYILKKELIEQIENLAYWERRMIKEIVGEALGDYVAKYEKKHGTIKPKPKK